MNVKEISDSIAYCGLVCKLCHLADQCSGCKSELNCCGTRTSEEGCYQYNCCNKKKFDGCWECPDFSCDKGMFSDSHDIRIKAFVGFIRMHGKEKLGELLIKNQQHGIYYGHNRDYDHLESEEKVISILLSGKIEAK